jgi:hypothetical protein
MCFDVILLFTLVILQKKSNWLKPNIIPLLNRVASEEEKKKISNVFLQFMKFKPCRIKMDESTTDDRGLLAIQLNNDTVIPIDGNYIPIKRPQSSKFTDSPYNTDINAVGALIIINGLQNPNSIYLNGSLGINLGKINENPDRFRILILYPEYIKQEFLYNNREKNLTNPIVSIHKDNCTLLTLQI